MPSLHVPALDIVPHGREGHGMYERATAALVNRPDLILG